MLRLSRSVPLASRARLPTPTDQEIQQSGDKPNRQQNAPQRDEPPSPILHAEE
jgi:hypothetical protein